MINKTAASLDRVLNTTTKEEGKKMMSTLDKILRLVGMTVLLVGLGAGVGAQVTGKLGNKQVVDMVKAGVPVDAVNAAIRAAEPDFEVSASAIGQLKRAGVPQAVIDVMIDRQAQKATEADQPSEPARGMFEPRGQLPGQASRSTDQEQRPNQNAATSGSLKSDLGSVEQKRNNVPRIGIATTISSVPSEQNEALRLQLYEMLYGNRPTSSVDAILLREKLDRNIVNEAKASGVDYVLFLSLESTIKSFDEKGKAGGFIGGVIDSIGEGTGVLRRSTSSIGKVYDETYKASRVVDSLQQSKVLLDRIDSVTGNKDKVSLKYRMVALSGGAALIPEAVMEKVAKRKNEPVFSNLLIEVGNKILNAIPENGAISAKPATIPLNQPISTVQSTTGVPAPTSATTAASTESRSVGAKSDIQQTCSTTISNAPAIRGIKLGMSLQQVDSVFRAAGMPAGPKEIKLNEDCWDKAAGRCVYTRMFIAWELPEGMTRRYNVTYGHVVASGPLKDVASIELRLFEEKVITIRAQYVHPAAPENNDDWKTQWRPNSKENDALNRQIEDSLGLAGPWPIVKKDMFTVVRAQKIMCSGFEASYTQSIQDGIIITLDDKTAENKIALSKKGTLDRKTNEAKGKAVTFKP